MSHQVASFVPENKFAGRQQAVRALALKLELAFGSQAEA